MRTCRFCGKDVKSFCTDCTIPVFAVVIDEHGVAATQAIGARLTDAGRERLARMAC